MVRHVRAFDLFVVFTTKSIYRNDGWLQPGWYVKELYICVAFIEACQMES